MILERKNAPALYYEHVWHEKDDATVLVLTGFGSGITTPLWNPVKSFCLENSVSYLALDYTGHGLSGGKPQDITIGQNVQDVLDVMNKVNDKPIVTVGFCYGGLMSLLAAEHTDRIKGMVACAPGVDFTRFLWDSYLSEDLKETISTGKIAQPFEEYPNFLLHKNLFETAVPYYRLEKGLEYTGPVTILHGQNDNFTPLSCSIAVKQALTKADVTLDIMSGRGHNVFEHGMEHVLKHLKRHIEQVRS